MAWRVLLFLAISCRISEFFNLATLNLSVFYHLFVSISNLNSIHFEFLAVHSHWPSFVAVFRMHCESSRTWVTPRQPPRWRGQQVVVNCRLGAVQWVDHIKQQRAMAWGISKCMRWVQEHWRFVCSSVWDGAVLPVGHRVIQVRVRRQLICLPSLLRHQHRQAIVMDHRSREMANLRHPSQAMEHLPNRQQSHQPNPQPSHQQSHLHHLGIVTDRRLASPARATCHPPMEAMEEEEEVVEAAVEEEVDRTYPLLSRSRS